MAIILRSSKGSTLTHGEMDNNFNELSNRVLLGAPQVEALIDSAYVQARQDASKDSAFVTGIVDSAYVTNIVQTAPASPVLQAFNVADSAQYNQFGAGTVIFLNDGDNGSACLAVKDSANGDFKIVSFGVAPSSGGGGF
tara:strand:+ start:410 stop:826 length:417 start_codon:yes stop_codon:yes gene_type:complete